MFFSLGVGYLVSCEYAFLEHACLPAGRDKTDETDYKGVIQKE
jgi:hypothetical protein